MFTARGDGSGMISMLGYLSLNVRQLSLNCQKTSFMELHGSHSGIRKSGQQVGQQLS